MRILWRESCVPSISAQRDRPSPTRPGCRPERLCSFLNPACARNSAARWLRPPSLQCTTISCVGSQFAHALWQVVERNQATSYLRSGKFVRFADIENANTFTCVEAALQLRRFHLRNAIDHRSILDYERIFCQKVGSSANLFIVQQPRDAGMRTADRAVRIFLQLEFAEAQGQCIHLQNSPDQWLALRQESA